VSDRVLRFPDRIWQEVRPHAPSVLAAPMPLVIASMALVAPGFSGAPVHEPVHGRGVHVLRSHYCARHCQEHLTYVCASELGPAFRGFLSKAVVGAGGEGRVAPAGWRR